MREPLPPLSRGLVRAGEGILRYGVLALNLGVLVLLRSTASTWVAAVAVVVALGLLVLVARRDATVRLWGLYMLGFLLFAQLRSVADQTGVPVRFDYVVELERSLFGGTFPTVWLQERLYSLGEIGALEIATVAVYTSYFVVPHLVVLALWLRRSPLFGRFAVAVLGTAYLGLAVSFAVPTAPPWLAAQSGHLPFVSRIVRDTFDGVDSSVYDRGYEVVGVNAVAAMPSLHLAMTVLILFAAWRGGLGVRLAGLGYALAMAFALVYAGEHYVVDLVAGVAAAALAWRAAPSIVDLVESRGRRRAAHDEPAIPVPALLARPDGVPAPARETRAPVAR